MSGYDCGVRDWHANADYGRPLQALVIASARRWCVVPAGAGTTVPMIVVRYPRCLPGATGVAATSSAPRR